MGHPWEWVEWKLASSNFLLQNGLKPILMGYYEQTGKRFHLNFLRTYEKSILRKQCVNIYGTIYNLTITG